MAYEMSPLIIAMSKGAAALSSAMRAAVANPSGMTVPMSAVTATRETSLGPGARAAVKLKA